MVSRTIDVAAVQMNSGADKEVNVADAIELIERAAGTGARLVALPEVWTYLGDADGIRDAAEEIPGPTIERLAEEARRHGIYLHCGSIFEQVPGDPCVYNTTAVLNPAGELIARYRKIHLFDVSFDGQFTYLESNIIAPGDEIVVVDVDDVKVGLSICYDLRFPELFRLLALQGAELIILPAAFTQYTGKDHWELLLRARAVENQVFMVAPNEHGHNPSGVTAYGRSMIVDPWGTVLATAPDGVGVIQANCNLELLETVRRELPSLANRQPSAYRWEQETIVTLS